MRWYFLIVGLCGAPFTSGLSILLGLVGFAYCATGERAVATARSEMDNATSPGKVAIWALLGIVGVLLLLTVALGAMGAVVMMIEVKP